MEKYEPPKCHSFLTVMESSRKVALPYPFKYIVVWYSLGSFFATLHWASAVFPHMCSRRCLELWGAVGDAGVCTPSVYHSFCPAQCLRSVTLTLFSAPNDVSPFLSCLPSFSCCLLSPLPCLCSIFSHG